jgi:glycosyltransferase involved in cell wall biosynthesis
MPVNHVNIHKGLFIGIPVFNGEAFISKALDSIIGQAFCDWHLLIADNCSDDNTEKIAREYVSRDQRISYIRHSSNIGAISNFLFLLNSAESDYFMWAAADDEWSKDYLQCCINTLDSCPNVQCVGGNVVNTDPAGLALRSYNGFSCFDSETRLQRLTNFLLSPEIGGKANLFYSVYRTDFCRMLSKLPNIFCGWGSDMTFVFAALNRGRYKYIPDISLHKRVISADDIKTAKLAENNKYDQIQYFGWFPITHFHEYREAYYKVATDNQVKVLIWLVMAYRYLALWCRLKCKNQSLLSFLTRWQ